MIFPCKYKTEETHCKYDCTDISGVLYMPQDSIEKHSAVIFSHGYNCIGNDMRDVAEKLAESGIVCYTFDYCGGSERSQSSGKSVDMSVTSEQENLRCVIDLISSKNFVDRNRIFLYGESQGGLVAALVGAEMPDRIAGMFLIYPAFCLVEQWRAMDPATMTEPFKFNGGTTLSRAFYDGLPKYDIFEHIKAFTNPVHIYQGDSDNVVSVECAEHIDESFPDSTLTVFEGAGHGFESNNRNKVIQELVNFVADRAEH